MRDSYLILGFVIGVVGAIALWRELGGSASRDAGPIVAVNVPVLLTERATAGKILFDQNCADCHGANAAGSDKGPPLIHKVYRPNHHADFAFVLAARSGVRAHHWDFGAMDPVPDLAEAEVLEIVAYVRELQRANGID